MAAEVFLVVLFLMIFPNYNLLLFKQTIALPYRIKYEILLIHWVESLDIVFHTGPEVAEREPAERYW